MTMCEEVHKQFDSIANADPQVGRLPEWMHIQGKAFWWVYQGSYEGLGDAWRAFGEMFLSSDIKGAGPPGDLYVCDPADHEDNPEKIITILWMPAR